MRFTRSSRSFSRIAETAGDDEPEMRSAGSPGTCQLRMTVLYTTRECCIPMRMSEREYTTQHRVQK